MTYTPESLPPTDAVIAAMHPDHPAAVADELHRLLAHCLVRDEEVRRERAKCNAEIVEKLARPVYAWVNRTPGLSMRTANVMFNTGLNCMADVVGMAEAELLRRKNMGRVCVNEIKWLRQHIGGTDADVAAAREVRPDHDATWESRRLMGERL
jgi:DNA-directed RNA polymerase alpha subunit